MPLDLDTEEALAEEESLESAVVTEVAVVATDLGPSTSLVSTVEEVK